MKTLLQLANLALNIINYLNIETIMATIKELNAKVDELQTALDVEQQQIKDAIDQLNQAVADLEVLAAAGGSEEERQALSDKIQGVIDDLSQTIPDAPSTTETSTEEPSTTETSTEEPSTTETSTEEPSTTETSTEEVI